METAALEPAPQIALRNCSKEAGEKDSIYVIFGEGEIHAMKHFFQKASASLVKSSLVTRNSVTMKDFSVLDRRRCKNWAHKNQLLRISNYLKTFPVSFPGAQIASFLLLTLNSFRGC